MEAVKLCEPSHSLMKTDRLLKSLTTSLHTLQIVILTDTVVCPHVLGSLFPSKMIGPWF